jgi:hypothetical protein
MKKTILNKRTMKKMSIVITVSKRVNDGENLTNKLLESYFGVLSVMPL